MSNNEEEQTQPIKRLRGRPKGSFKVRPEAAQREQHAATLDQLLALSPLPEQHNRTKRLSPTAWNAKREALLLTILEREPGFAMALKEQPKMYNPETLEAHIAVLDELERIIAYRNSEQSHLDTIADLERCIARSEEHAEINADSIATLKQYLTEAKAAYAEKRFPAPPPSPAAVSGSGV